MMNDLQPELFSPRRHEGTNIYREWCFRKRQSPATLLHDEAFCRLRDFAAGIYESPG